MGMEKKTALDLFGGIAATARAVGVTPAAVSQWPEQLPDRLRDRVQAALWRASAAGHQIHAWVQFLDQAISIAGGIDSLARSVGVAPGAVSMWKSRGRVPAEHCPAIERLTKGAVRCEELRPDIPWGVLRGSPQTEAEHA